MRIRLLSLLSVVMVNSVSTLFAQQAKCDAANVHYQPPSPEIASKIHVSEFSARDTWPSALSRQRSVQGTRWFVEADPDYAKEGPWSTTLYIGEEGKAAPFVRLHIDDHGNTFTARWINDKLLFVQVWWGRLASSDLILDVKQRKFIYNEFAHYGKLADPCSE